MGYREKTRAQFIRELSEMRGRVAELEASEAERKREADEALQESEVRLKLALEAARMGTWDSNLLTGELAWSASVEPLFGLAPGTFQGTREAFYELVHPEDRERVRRAVNRAAEEEVDFDVEHRVVWPDGAVRWVENRGRIYRGRAENSAHLLGTVMDITERKQAEEAFRQVHEELERRVEERTAELSRANATLKEEVGERRRVEAQIAGQSAVLNAINRVFREALTCETEEEVARTCLAVAEDLTGSKFGFIGEMNPAGRFDTIALSDPGFSACRMPSSDAVAMIKDMEIRGIWSRTLRDGRSLIVDDPASHPDRVGTPEGHPPLTSFLGVPLKRGGRTVGMIALANRESGYGPADRENVESLSVAFMEALMGKRAEEELKSFAERLERSNRELQDFAYVASHDLQEPLRKVQAFGDRLRTRYGDAFDDRGRDYLERMQNAAGRMQTLINDLLTLSRVTTRARPFVPVDLTGVVREVVADLELHIERTGGRVDVGDLPTIDADPTQMHQLFQNLIGNGLKFHRPGEAPAIGVTGGPLGERAGGSCRVHVEDNGIGFDEKYLDRIFVPFQRLHGRLDYEGTGMGLAICRKIVDRHGGDITARSTPGVGTVFVVSLPLRHPPGEEAP